MKIASLSLSLAYIANYPSHTKADGEEVLHLRIREHATSTKQPVAAEVNDVDLGPIVADVINGDDVTSRDRYPWMAQIPYSSGSHCCGGSLVAPDFVLCAAHCQGCSTNGEAIRIGPRDLNSAQGEEIPIANKFIHPQYNSGALDYDYMLWQLQSSSTYDPVAINPSSSVPANFGDEIHVIGWGELENGGSTAILQEAMVPYQDCADSNYAFTDRMMCAEFTGSPIRDACVGDSGGPLFMKGVDATEDMQVGIVSWGDYPCDREGEYGVYARVSAEFAWIQETICDNSNADLSRTNLNCGSTPLTKAPSKAPSSNPASTSAPTGDPTKNPTGQPTGVPSKAPSKAPIHCNGDGTCGKGESCDGRDGSIPCSDCDGVTTGPNKGRFCYVEGTCVGSGCGDGGGGGGGDCTINDVCGAGESCDGRDGTTPCSDCAGVTKGPPSERYCYIDGVCEGSGCP